MSEPEKKSRGFFWNFLVWIDQGANAVLGPVLNAALKPHEDARFGDPDETLSSVFGKNVQNGSCKGCKWMCKLLHRIDPEHCEKSIEADEGQHAADSVRTGPPTEQREP